MTLREQKFLKKLTVMYLRTFPPTSKNGNGKIGDFKRWLLLIPINIIVKGDRTIFEKFLKEDFERL